MNKQSILDRFASDALNAPEAVTGGGGKKYGKPAHKKHGGGGGKGGGSGSGGGSGGGGGKGCGKYCGKGGGSDDS